jgi:hypothetical protein
MDEPETANGLIKADSPQVSLDSSEPVLKGIALWQIGYSMREAARRAGRSLSGSAGSHLSGRPPAGR